MTKNNGISLPTKRRYPPIMVSTRSIDGKVTTQPLPQREFYRLVWTNQLEKAGELLFATFDPGSVEMTQAVADSFPPKVLVSALRRHLSRNWGDLDLDDRRMNNGCIVAGKVMGQVLSSFRHEGKTFWIITNSGEQATTFLLPIEY